MTLEKKNRKREKERERQKEIKGTDRWQQTEEKKHNVTLRHRHTTRKYTGSSNPERGFPSTSSLIGTGLTVGKIRLV